MINTIIWPVINVLSIHDKSCRILSRSRTDGTRGGGGGGGGGFTGCHGPEFHHRPPIASGTMPAYLTGMTPIKIISHTRSHSTVFSLCCLSFRK